MSSALKPKTQPEIINGIGAIAPDYDAFILDIWGVLHNGIQPFPGTIDCLTNLKQQGKRVLLLSNTPDRGGTIAEYLGGMGITSDLYQDIVTAGDSAYQDITARQGQSCWYAGYDGAVKLTQGLDVRVLGHHEDADFIVNVLFDLSEDEKAETYRLLEEAKNKDLPMICANPDMVVHVGEELKICPGTYALHYEKIGGTVIYHGKPHAPIYQLAWERLGRPEKSRIVAIGDSLHTDIQGANNFGITSILNLIGIHWEELQCDNAPGTVDDIKTEAVIRAQPHRPDALIAGFQW